MVRRMARAGGVLAIVVLLGVLVATAVDPGSGTSTNLQSVDDVHSLVIGDHHAKPVPRASTSDLAELLVAVAAVTLLAGTAIAPVAPTAHWSGRRRWAAEVRHLPRQLVAWAARAHRAPPLRSLA